MSGTNVYFDNPLYESETFTSSGTFNVPDGVNLVFIELWGGGSGGGADKGINGFAAGGKSATPFIGPVPVTPGGTVSVTIGLGGDGSDAGNPSIEGGDSSFGSIFSRGGKAVADDGIGSEQYKGRGLDSFRSLGGNDFGTFATDYAQGGDAGYEAGGNAGDDINGPAPTNGGRGAGGGASNNVGSGVGAGDGGNGICIVYWNKS